MSNRNVMLIALLLAGCGGVDAGYGDGSFQDPAAFLAFGSSDHAVTLAWLPVPGATGYMLERASGAGEFEPVAATGPNATDYLDLDLTETAYTYRIHAIGDTGISTGLTHTATLDADDAAWTTPDEEPASLPIVQTVGATGAVIVADGASITIPPQAFATDTQVTVMSIANPIPGDPRPGVDVTFGQELAQPVRISFALDETDASDLVVVRKQDDNTWLAQHFEVGAGTVTMTLAIDEFGRAKHPGAPAQSRSHARVLPPLRSTFVTPRFVRVGLNGSTSLSPIGLFSKFPCATTDTADQAFCDAFHPIGQLVRTITAKSITEPIGNNDPGYATSWSVEGTIGGDATHGTIAPTGSYGAFYRAPAMLPSGCSHPCRVQVTFDARNTATGANATPVRAIVELVPSSWVGTASSTSTANITTNSMITWNLDTTSTDTTVVTYRPDAAVTATMSLENCSVTVNWVYISTDSVLTIDYRQEPPTYSAIGSGSMDVTVTCAAGSYTYDLALTWMPYVANQPLVNNATEISGHQDDGVASYDWSFHPGT